MHYFEHNSQFQGRLEVCRELYSLLESKPPQGAEESTLWDHAWNKIAFGVQLEMDRAEKEIFNQAHAAAKGGSKGISSGKSSMHYSTPLIYSSEYNPFPISMTVIPVDEVSLAGMSTVIRPTQPSQRQAVTLQLPPRVNRLCLYRQSQKRLPACPLHPLPLPMQSPGEEGGAPSDGLPAQFVIALWLHRSFSKPFF